MEPRVTASRVALFNTSLPEVQRLFPLSEQSIPPADEEIIAGIDTVLASLPSEPFSWNEEIRRKTAQVAAGLFRFRNVDCSYYIPRKNLSFTLPRNMKIIVDFRTDGILFLEKKGANSRFGMTKVGRKVYRVIVFTRRTESHFSLSPTGQDATSRKKNYAQFCSERNAEKAIQERVASGYPRRILDYEYYLKQQGSFRKRLSICERYDDDLLKVYNSTHLHRFPLRMFGLMLRMAECVQGYHNANFTLRDIKPENFVVSHDEVQTPHDFFDTSWKVAFCDLGFVLDENQREGAQVTLCGSPPYCSPELLRLGIKHTPGWMKGKNVIDFYTDSNSFDLASSDLRPADIYALGILFYTMMHQGDFPWSEPKDIADQFEKQMQLSTDARHSEIVFDLQRPDVQAALDPIILSMLTVSIAERATIDQVLQRMHTLEQQVHS